MPLPEKEYFTLEEVEERWSMERRDTIYYAENGLLKVAIRVFDLVIETGVIEKEPDGRWIRVLEDYTRYSGLLVLLSCDLATLFWHGSTIIDSFHVGEGRYGDIVKPKGGLEVHIYGLVVTRAERDRFEREHELNRKTRPTPARAKPASCPINCSDDGSWINIDGREYLFSGVLQRCAVRRLYEAQQNGSPRLGMQALLEEIESRSRHISQVFSGADPRWRDLIGYGKGHVWLKINV